MSKKYAAVLGSPIGHSQSPQLHSAAYQTLGLDIDYTRIEVPEPQAAEFFAEQRERIAAGTDICGFSVTMPLKAAMVPLMDHIDERVEKLGVLNTIVFDADGRTTGYNTDVDGIIQAISRGSGRTAFPKVAILGGGGTAAAAIAACSGLETREVTVFARNEKKVATQLALASSFGLSAAYSTLESFAQVAQQYDAVISTLPPCAADGYARALQQPVAAPLLDVAYDPWPSALATQWHDKGGRVISGINMLLHQAVEQVRLFTQRFRRADDVVDWDAIATVMGETIEVHPGR